MVRTALFAMHSKVGREVADHWDALSASERYVRVKCWNRWSGPPIEAGACSPSGRGELQWCRAGIDGSHARIVS